MNIIGGIATLMAIIMYIPQVYKVAKHKSAIGISKVTFLLIVCGSSIWLVAAPLGNAGPSWVANATILLLMIIIIFYIFKGQIKIFLAITTSIILILVVSLILGVYQYMSKPTLPSGSKIFFVTLAGTLLSCSLIPQVIKIFKTKYVGEFSLFSNLLVIANNTLGVLYGLLKVFVDSNFDLVYNEVALVGSAMPLIMPFTIMAMHYKYKEI